MDVCGQVGLGGEVFCGPLPRECRLLLEASLGCWGSGIWGGRDPEVLPHPSHPPCPRSAEHPSGLSNTSGALRGRYLGFFRHPRPAGAAGLASPVGGRGTFVLGDMATSVLLPPPPLRPVCLVHPASPPFTIASAGLPGNGGGRDVISRKNNEFQKVVIHFLKKYCHFLSFKSTVFTLTNVIPRSARPELVS